MSPLSQKGRSQRQKNRKQNAKQYTCSDKLEKANSVDPDEMARYGPPRLDLHCLQNFSLSSLQSYIC